MKFGMNAGDFLLSSNILLSGNNYAKVALLFKFMNMKMVSRTLFFRIQEHYCMDAIQKFWDKKREETIYQLQSKDSVVVLSKPAVLTSSMFYIYFIYFPNDFTVNAFHELCDTKDC